MGERRIIQDLLKRIIGLYVDIMSESTNKKASNPWITSILLTLAATVVAMAQNKPVTILPIIMESLNVDIAKAGLMMSVFALSGLLLALPAGYICQKLSPKKTILLALLFVAAGSVFGALTNSFSILLFTRFIEGAGMGLVIVAAPAFISMLFSPDEIGKPMGIFSVYMTVGTVLIFNLAPALAKGSAWKASWWLIAAASAVMIALVQFFAKMPEVDGAGEGEESGQPSMKDALKSKSLWMIGLAYFMFATTLFYANTYLPTYLQKVFQMEAQKASLLATIPALLGVVSAPLYGTIADKMKAKKKIMLFGLLVFAPVMAGVFLVPESMLVVMLVLWGLLVMGFPAIIMASAPETVPSVALAGIAMAILAFFQNLGGFIGPAVYGNILASQGWATTGIFLIPLGILALIFGAQVKIK